MSTPAVSPLSVDDFAAKIKAKYPDYASMDNMDLAQKIVAKHPEYADKVSFAPSTPAGPPNAGLAGAARPSSDMTQVNRVTGSPDLLSEDEKSKLTPVIQNQLRDYYANDPVGMHAMGTASNLAQGAQDLSQGKIKKGVHGIVKGAGIGMLPFAAPAVAAAPLASAGAVGAGYLGGKAGKGIAKLSGGDEDTQNLAEDAGNLAGGYAGAKGLPFLAKYLPKPQMQQAGQLFNQAASAANPASVDVSEAGNTALRIQEAAGRGGWMPKVVRDFVRRTTDPEKGPLTYEEARDFYQNASQLSADEAGRLKPVQKRMIGQFASNLGNSIQNTATGAGVGPQYSQAMSQYRNAAQMNKGLNTIGQYAGRQILEKLPWLAAVYGGKKIFDSVK